MENYITIFDSAFLPQGLALHASMERHAGKYILWILCVDNNAYEVLTALNLPNIRLLQLSLLETEALKRVKPMRTVAEYCWTLTPFSPYFVFEADPAVNRVTYLDADLWFRKSPTPIFKEFEISGKHVLITDHAYAPEYDQSATSGQYCVQFIIFTRESEPVRKWWEDRCIEWCYARLEKGRFGDQKYLDSWPELFPEHVHVLENRELLLAPWNATRYPYGNAVGWHFHGFRISGNKSKYVVRYCPYYKLPTVVRKFIYRAYVSDIRLAVNMLNEHGFLVHSQMRLYWYFFLRGLVRKTLTKIFNIRRCYHYRYRYREKL